MLLDDDACYLAIKAHDARFDGRFFVGVTSTGIYCRPICRVKAAKRENCRFYRTAAAAEGAGFRPCLRCRPELAPGNSILEASSQKARAAAMRIEEGFLEDGNLVALAANLGIADRHLRRIFRAEFGVSVIEYAQTQRLLMAKRLLTDTSMSIVNVALTSGFASVRRFNALFQARYRLKPSALRGAGISRAPSPGSTADVFLTFDLAYRPPLAWDEILHFLADRTVAGVEEVVDGRRYRRTVAIATPAAGMTAAVCGWVEVCSAHPRHALTATLAPSLARAVPAVLAKVRRLFDLACDPTAVREALEPSLAVTPGLRVPGAFDGFELAVRAVLGQQVSVKAARTLAGRFAARFGEPMETPYGALSQIFPRPQTIARRAPEELSTLGVTRARANTLIALARAVSEGSVDLGGAADVALTTAALRRLPGIGEWTAEYIAMRALAWPDAFPHGDLGLRKALGATSSAKVLALAERWRPWRSYAAISLWQSLHAHSGRQS